MRGCSVPADPDGDDLIVLPEHPNQDATRRAEIAPSQQPFAVLFGCSDSRLSAEIIFDRGLGDLFVVCTAGHVMGPEVLGSIEFDMEVPGCPLAVILGHDSCGAVDAACAALRWTRPWHPQTNGKVKRFHRTLLEEWATELDWVMSVPFA